MNRGSGWTRKVMTTKPRAREPRAREEPTRASQLSSATMQAAILEALAPGPLSKVDLRDQLRLNEGHLTRELQALRDDGQVKPIGNLTKRKYALKTYQAPFMTRPVRIPGEKDPAAPPASSWWTEAQGSREAFTSAAAVRARERAWRR